MDWERTCIEAAAEHLRELIETGAGNARTKAAYEALLDVLDPTRHATRIQRAAAADAAAAIMRGTRDRRGRMDRRGHSDRRLISLGSASGGENRAGRKRRKDSDRRNR